jgi:hypothetical protein
MHYSVVFNQSAKKLIKKIVEAYTPLAKAFEQAYAKARNER